MIVCNICDKKMIDSKITSDLLKHMVRCDDCVEKEKMFAKINNVTESGSDQGLLEKLNQLLH